MSSHHLEIEAFETLEFIKDCKTSDAIHQVLENFVKRFGFEYFIMGNLPPVGFMLEPHVLLQSWPQDWYQHYISERHYDHDPIARHARRVTHPFLWSRMPHKATLSMREMQVFHDASEFGLHNGLMVPLYGLSGLTSCISFAAQKLDLPPRGDDAIYMVSLYAYEATERLQKEAISSQKPVLSKREQEVLCWVAKGKTDHDIATICGISPKTAYAHVKHAANKLDAVNRSQAVAKALIHGHIRL